MDRTVVDMRMDTADTAVAGNVVDVDIRCYC